MESALIAFCISAVGLRVYRSMLVITTECIKNCKSEQILKESGETYGLHCSDGCGDGCGAKWLLLIPSVLCVFC